MKITAHFRQSVLVWSRDCDSRRGRNRYRVIYCALTVAAAAASSLVACSQT